MDRGPSGPRSTCATNRKQRVDMQRHVETGQFVQDAQSMPFGGSSEDDYTNSDTHDGLLTIHDQVRKNSCGRVVDVHDGDCDCLVLVWRVVPRSPPRGETTLNPPADPCYRRSHALYYFSFCQRRVRKTCGRVVDVPEGDADCLKRAEGVEAVVRGRRGA